MMSLFTLSNLFQWILLIALVNPSAGRLYTDPTQLKKTTYDFIVVGAGTAGNVVAARLTENPRISVLVLEAGVSNENVLASEVPLLAPQLAPNTLYDWNYTTTPQRGYNGRTITYPRGKLVGGSSSLNYMVYSHGSSDDWDRYANVTGDIGWSWDNIKQYIQKNERFVPPADHHNVTGQVDLALHGFYGAVSVSVSGYPVPSDSRVIATTQELSGDFPFRNDTSGGDTIGIGWTLSAIGNGTRSSSATAYLEPSINRPNLDILVNAQVTKLIKDRVKNGIPSFRSVQFAANETGRYIVTANHEVILSAGSVGTPVILQLSGIGDRADLDAASITTLVHNPSVGKNLSDHALQANIFETSGNATLDDLFRNTALLNNALAQWNHSRTGPLVYPFANQLGWLRLPNNATIFGSTIDPSAGPRSAHYEMIFLDFWINPGVSQPSTGHYFTIVTAVISPTSRGTVKISSSDPFEKPLIDPQFLTTPFDVYTMVESVKAAKRFATATAWNGYFTGPYGDLANAETDDQIKKLVRGQGGTVFHPVGTAAMSAKGDSWGVVDPDLKVKGVEGLRVVDGSVLTYIPSAHTHGPIYLVGERGADLIKSDWEKGRD